MYHILPISRVIIEKRLIFLQEEFKTTGDVCPHMLVKPNIMRSYQGTVSNIETSNEPTQVRPFIKDMVRHLVH